MSAKKTDRRKKGRPKSNLDRQKPHLYERPSILIVCEGEKTEPSYFKQFRISSADVKPLGTGFNTVSLVKKAIELSIDEHYDQVWCVFDKDDFPDTAFNEAISIVENYNKDEINIEVAYSNQAFEYWLILHFEDHQGGGMHRNYYSKKINTYLKDFKITYGKDKEINSAFFDILNGIDSKTNKKRVKLAIERAKRNHEKHKKDALKPAQQESTTTVFRLVEELINNDIS